MYARVRPGAYRRDAVFTRADIARVRRAERRAWLARQLARAGRVVWWTGLCVSLFVIAASAGYLVPIAYKVWRALP